MTTRIGLLKARGNLGDLAARARYGAEEIILTDNGKDAAVLLDPAEYRRLRALEDAADLAELAELREDVRAGRAELLPLEQFIARTEQLAAEMGNTR